MYIMLGGLLGASTSKVGHLWRAVPWCRKGTRTKDGSRSYFPARLPRTVRFKISDTDASDQYARLYSTNVVSVINALTLPRYGLGNYVAPKPKTPPTAAESKILDDLSRAGNRLRGFCRTNLFKRLESSGHTFLLSVERHILRNYVFLYAIENDLPLPIGTFDAGLLDAQSTDADADGTAGDLFEDDDPDANQEELPPPPPFSELDLRKRAVEIYQLFADRLKKLLHALPRARFNRIALLRRPECGRGRRKLSSAPKSANRCQDQIRTSPLTPYAGKLSGKSRSSGLSLCVIVSFLPEIGDMRAYR